MSSYQYAWQNIDVLAANLSSISQGMTISVYATNPPEGYRLHSWNVIPYGNGQISICWIKETSVSLPGILAQVPAEWTAPILEWIKRFVIKG